MTEERERSGATAKVVTGELARFAVVFVVIFLVQEVVYRATGWDRLWILLVVAPLTWLVMDAAQRRWEHHRAARLSR